MFCIRFPWDSFQPCSKQAFIYTCTNRLHILTHCDLTSVRLHFWNRCCKIGNIFTLFLFYVEHGWRHLTESWDRRLFFYCKFSKPHIGGIHSGWLVWRRWLMSADCIWFWDPSGAFCLSNHAGRKCMTSENDFVGCPNAGLCWLSDEFAVEQWKDRIAVYICSHICAQQWEMFYALLIDCLK